MLKKLTVVILMVMQSCGQLGGHKEPEFAEIVQDFENTYDVKTYAVSIMFVDSFQENQEGKIGECYTAFGLINILRSAWVELDDVEKTLLIYHELGHCQLHRAHLEILFDDGCPISIMYPSIFSDYCYNKHKDELIKELNSRRDFL